MSKTKLSENLEYWRSERPSEWKMDEFIRQAQELEESLLDAADAISEAGYAEETDYESNKSLDLFYINNRRRIANVERIG